MTGGSGHDGGCPGMTGGIWAVVPVKDLQAAKQRLSPLLSASERAALSLAMLADVLAALTTARDDPDNPLCGVLVVAREQAVQDWARQRDVDVMAEAENRGYGEAVSDAGQRLAADGAAAILVLPGDLPLLGAEDVKAVLAALQASASVVLAPSGDESGTNALACKPPTVLPPAFGVDSFRRHRDIAKALGLSVALVRRPGLALDIDSAEDLRTFLALDSEFGVNTRKFLTGADIAERLGETRAGQGA